MYKQTVTLFLFISISSANGYQVQITDDGPIVKGGIIHFYVTVYKGGEPATGQYKYEWKDNAIPEHTRETDLQNSTDSWTVIYEADKYPMGSYLVQVSVKACVFSIVCYEVGSDRHYFEITGTLNGDFRLVQRNETRKDNFVSNKDAVIHQIELKKSDRDYISKAPTVLTYWFVDCTYYGITTDFKFPFNYTLPDKDHIVEALVMADFTPLPPTTTVPPSTTTTKPTSTTTTASTTTMHTTANPVTTTTKKPNSTTLVSTTSEPDVSSPISKMLTKRSIDTYVTNIEKNVTSRVMVKVNGSLVPSNLTFPFVCNGSQVMTDSKKVYGFFYKKVVVKAPISSVNVTGNNWIQQGDLLSLQITCQGSKDIGHCVQQKRGAYNVTGNETCDDYVELNSCEFPFKRYLPEKKYTILIIIKNQVNKVVTPVTVTVYEVKKQAQLSVIVVPVAFSLVAVVLIVFGVAYYIQNRSRFIIEVADFNFGKQYSDMEYKTFRERLRESVTNAFTRGPSPSSSEVPVWPPGRKYGSMT